MHDRKRGPGKDKRRGATPDEVAAERGQLPEERQDGAEDDSIDDQDRADCKNDRRERRRDRHE